MIGHLLSHATILMKDQEERMKQSLFFTQTPIIALIDPEWVESILGIDYVTTSTRRMMHKSKFLEAISKPNNCMA
jgi:hypothetical protein